MSENLRLRALLAHPANGGLRAVAGPAEAEWNEVVIESNESELPAEVSGGIAILSASPPTTPWQQDALIRRVRDRGFVALAMPGIDNFGAGNLALATRLGLSVLHVDKPLMLAKACWQLLEARDALTLGYVRKVAQSIEYHATGLPDLLHHLSSNVGHAIALIDEKGVLLEAGGHFEPAMHSAVNFAPWVDLARIDGGGTAASVRVDSPSRAGLRIAFFGNGLSDPQLRALGVAAEVAMPAVAARILIDEVVAVNEASVSSGLLRDFLEQRGGIEAELEQRLLDHGWRTAGFHLGFRILGRTRLDSFQLLRFVTQQLGQLAVDSHATMTGRGVTGWLTFTESQSPRQLEQHVFSLRKVHNTVRKAFNVATGVGAFENGSAGLVATISGATDAARIAANRSGTGWFVRFDALGLEQLLLSWTEHDTFVPAAESLLAPLAVGGGELLATLSAYLDHESGTAATATALRLHRNTVATRIQRVQELLGVDMSDPETRLALHLACRAVRSK
ncbi:PucR family transcriptional regulator [Glaciibacter superstes]|uniref:PucR family transcriptional regulator n=1 Tax=Glaciibacter superstes TaxID=501023 RepID=UPI0003B3DC08|nr:helix-turn-helix domain-containing protein [Glaciibacter superstes]